MKIVLLFLSTLSFTSMAFCSTHNPRWSPHKSEYIVIYGKDGDSEILLYVIDDIKFMGLGFQRTNPH